MLYAELIRLIRLRLDDINEPVLWQDDEIQSYISDTLSDLASRTFYPVTSLFYVLTPETYTVALPDWIYSVQELLIVEGSETPLEPIFRVEYDYIIQRIRSAASPGKPTMFAIRENVVYLFPKPDKAYNVNAIVRGFNSEEALDPHNEIKLPPRFLNALILGCLAKAYTKSDSETFRPDQADRFTVLYEKEKESLDRTAMFHRGTVYRTPIHTGLL